MKWEMEVLSSYLSNASWLIDESKNTKWTQAENKMFENALAVYDKDTPDRWQRVAAIIPGKTVADVIKQYKELEDDVSNIEAGLVPIPGYNTTTSVFTLEWVNNNNNNNNVYDGDGYKNAYAYTPCGKRGPGSRASDHERKKGVPWTEEEHKLFLMGLKKYGKGDWRNISRNFVITRTPTQVASHAQKYFIRQLSGGKDKRRASIHDITTLNIDNQNHLSPDHSTINNKPSNSKLTLHKAGHFQWEHQNSSGGADSFDSVKRNVSMTSYGVGFYGTETQGHNLESHDFLENFIGSRSIGFEIQSNQHYPHG